MIFDRTPLSMNEVAQILEGIDESEKKQEIDAFLKKFCKAKPEQAKKIKETLEKMDSLKVKREHIVKVIDLLPEDASDLAKIFVDVSLSENEAHKIIELVKDSK